MKPLLDIFDKPPVAGSLRQIFVLTDGEGVLARPHRHRSEYLGASQSTLTLAARCTQFPILASALRPCDATPAPHGSLRSALAREPVGYPTYHQRVCRACQTCACVVLALMSCDMTAESGGGPGSGGRR